MNFSSSAAGSIQVEIQDANGSSVPNFSLDESEMPFGDSMQRTIVWKNGSDLGSLIGQTIRLRFVLKDAQMNRLNKRNSLSSCPLRRNAEVRLDALAISEECQQIYFSSP
jgi:hypothetical protein